MLIHSNNCIFLDKFVSTYSVKPTHRKLLLSLFWKIIQKCPRTSLWSSHDFRKFSVEERLWKEGLNQVREVENFQEQISWRKLLKEYFTDSHLISFFLSLMHRLILLIILAFLNSPVIRKRANLKTSVSRKRLRKNHTRVRIKG